MNQSVVRVLFVKVDPRIFDTLVEHAKTGHFHPRAEEEAEAEQKSKDQESAKADAKDSSEKPAETAAPASES